MSNHSTNRLARNYLFDQLTIRGHTMKFGENLPKNGHLILSSPSGRYFEIEVHGLRAKNFWLLREPPVNPDLFYAFIYIPVNDLPRVFIMTCEATLKFWQGWKEYTFAHNLANANEDYQFSGIHWNDPLPFEDNYGILSE